MSGKYTGPAIVLHWLVAIGIFLNLKSGLSLEDLPEAEIRGVIDLHKSIGISVLGLVLLRILWRVGHRPPALPARTRPWERKLSAATHYALYALMALVPLLGWLHDSAWKGAATHPLVLFDKVPWFRIPLFGGMGEAAKDQIHEILGNAHGAFSWLMMAALLLHVAGALKHQLIDKEKSLQRMWFGGKTD